LAFLRIWSAVLVHEGVLAVVPAVDEGADFGVQFADGWVLKIARQPYYRWLTGPGDRR
jgi:hypothetical protein